MLEHLNEITREEAEKQKIRSNFHTHNYLCGHAEGTVCDYVEEALSNGLTTLGVSDHVKLVAEVNDPYITRENLETQYLPQFDSAKKAYGDRIRILSGCEVEYFDGYGEYFDYLKKRLDYLVLGQHYYYCGGRMKFVFCDGVDEKNISAYLRQINDGIERDIFSLIAHPDAIFSAHPEITPKIYGVFEETVILAATHGVPLELNANGLRFHGGDYPTDILVELCKKHNAKVIISSDCHSPKYLCDGYVKKLYAYARKMHLNVVDDIVLKNK